MKKYDFYLAGAMCFIALVLYLLINFSHGNGEEILVYKDNELVNEYSLSLDGTYDIETDGHTVMTFEIKDSSVNVISADCKDKLCVRQKPIALDSEMICCLPNKILLKIDAGTTGDAKGEYDAITQ